MTEVAQHTTRGAAPLVTSDAADRLLLVVLLCWIAAVLVILRLTHRRPPERDVRRPNRSSPRPRPTDAGWHTPDTGPRAHRPAPHAEWRVADRLHQVPVQIIAPSSAPDRAGGGGGGSAAAMLEDLAGPVLDARSLRYRRSWGGVLLHGADVRGIAELAATLAAAHEVPLLVVRAHDIVPVDRRPVAAPVLALAATMAPCVLLIEGVDELADPTAPLVVSRHARRVEHELTTAVRSHDPTSRAVVLASARSVDRVATALTQDGCFDRQIGVGLPTAQRRRLLVQTELLLRHAVFDDALDEAAHLTAGMTEHHIMRVIGEACRVARVRAPVTEPLPVSTVDLRAALRRPSGGGPLAIGRGRETRIRDLIRRARDPDDTFGMVLAGDERNGGADVARCVAARARRAVVWLDARELDSLPAEELDAMVVAACDQLPVMVVWERLDALVGGDTSDGRRRKSVLAAMEHLARTPGACVIATMRRPELLDPMLVEDGTLEVMWIPSPDFHDRVALLAHALGPAVLVDTTIEELAAALHGATREQVMARCTAAIDAACLRQRAYPSRPLEVLRADFREPPAALE